MRTRAEKAQYVVDCIRALGLEPKGRILQMHDAFVDSNGKGRGNIQRTDPRFQIAIESDRDLTQLEYIFDNIPEYHRDDAFSKKFRHVLNDPALPEREIDRNTPGRDAQLELFIFANCHSAGLVPASLTEPDVVCTSVNRPIGIAAKRVKSDSAFSRNVRKGAEQIDRSGINGVVAVDTCVMLNPANDRLILQFDAHDFAKVWQTNINSYLSHHIDELGRIARRTGLIGLILHDHRIAAIADDWVVLSMTTGVRLSDDRALFDAFFSSYRAGFPEQEYLD